MRTHTTLALALLAASAAASPSPQRLRARNLVPSSAMKDSYDFVIVGGGLAGLVLGARLSEDANHTVLVLEAGGSGEETEAIKDRITIPGYTYYAENIPGINWNFQTTPQKGAGGRQLAWPRGKVLGGSGAINGLYMNRPGELEVQAWHDLLAGMDGADNWTWDKLFAAMKKSETFNPPSDDIAQKAQITYDAASHGTSGPIHYSYPGYTFDTVGDWSTAMQNLGMPLSRDTYGGENWGVYVATSAINPSNWTRSYSKSGYLDPLPPRANYDVVTNAFVTRLIIDPSTKQATAVEYSLDGSTTKTVKVGKEAILAGGTVGSPAVLLHSGVGPKDVLADAGVDVVEELPGVGQHLQDHVSLNLQWTTDSLTAGAVYNGDGPEKNDPVFLSFVNSATAYLNASALFGASGAPAFASGITDTLDVALAQVPSTDPTVLAGYKAIYAATAKLAAGPVGQLEMLLAINSAGAIRITAALQHPLSHGRIYIDAETGAFGAPKIDPNYLAHGADSAVLRQGLRLARQLGNTAPLSSLMTSEVLPGAAVSAEGSDAEWDAWLQTQIGTEFHPSSSCAMLPRALGGVVDASLKVYGLKNVRVADASVPPIVWAAHLMAGTYGLAEIASDIVRAEYNGGTVPGGGNGSGSGNGGSGGDGADGDNAAHAVAARPVAIALAVVVVALARFLL